MKKIINLLLLILCSCTHNNTAEDDFSDVLNSFLESYQTKNDLLILDTEPVTLDTIPNHNTITLKYLELYVQKGFLKHEDINYILDQVKSSKSIRLDSTKFKIRTMTNDKLKEMFKSMGPDSAMNYLNNQKINQIAFPSTPLFSIDKSVIIFWIKEWRSYLNAQGLIFILKKKDHKWILIESGGTFES